MPSFASQLDAIPVVNTTAERAGKFPSPSTNQRVHNLETGAIDRWNGSAWVSTPLTLPVSLAGMTFTAPVLLPNGSLALPAIAFAADPDTGFYSSGAGLITLVIGGVAAASFTPSVAQFLGPVETPYGLSVEGILSLDGASVDLGAPDSGGAGYRLLRVPNA